MLFRSDGFGAARALAELALAETALDLLDAASEHLQRALRAFRDAVRHIVRHRDRLWITTPGEIARYCESLPKGTISGSE